MGTTKKCMRCKKEIVTRKKECDESGYIFHTRCFRCAICLCVLNEYTVNVRGKKIMCKDHGRWYGKIAPLCKVYYIPFATCYRLIIPPPPPPKEEDKGKKGGKSKGGARGGGPGGSRGGTRGETRSERGETRSARGETRSERGESRGPPPRPMPGEDGPRSDADDKPRQTDTEREEPGEGP